MSFVTLAGIIRCAHKYQADDALQAARARLVRALTPLSRLGDMPWEELVDLVERPPLHSPGRWSPVDKRMNTGEFFVHHEDVRRAQPQWHARQLLHDEQKDLWNILKLMGPALLRKESNSVVLLANGFGAVRGGKRSARRVDLVRGEPSELLLWAFGRQEQADVEITQE